MWNRFFTIIKCETTLFLRLEPFDFFSWFVMYVFQALEKRRMSFILPGTKAENWTLQCYGLRTSLHCASIQALKLGKFFFPDLTVEKAESSFMPSSHRHFSPEGQSPGQPWRLPKHCWYTELDFWVLAFIYSVWISYAPRLVLQWGRSTESWRS